MADDNGLRSLADGLDKLRQGDVDEALGIFQSVLHIHPGHPLALYGMGVAHIRQGRFSEAASYLVRAAALLPDSASADFSGELYLALGLSSRQSGRIAAGDLYYRIAIVIRPEDAQSWFNLANGLADAGRPNMAISTAHRAALLRYDWPDAWNNLGRLENDLERLVEADMSYRRSLLLDPSHLLAWNNLGVVAKKRDQISPAINCFQYAVFCNPSQEEAWSNLGRNLLLAEKFNLGWAALSHNWLQQGFEPDGGWFKHPVWDGTALPDDKALLVWCGDKIGDEILYASFLPEVLARAGRVVFLVNPRLYEIFMRSFKGPLYAGLDLVPWDGQSPPGYDAHRIAAFYPLDFIGGPLMEERAALPPARSLLRVDSALTRQFDSDGDDLRIGLFWRSANSIIGSYKSQALEDWRGILSTPGVRFFSLQYGDVSSEIENLEAGLKVCVELPEEIDQLTDMDRFAAFLSTLDLVISIPSTTVHVAGSIGVPAWVLLPAGPGLSWFWFLRDDHARWYPGLRLFRQKKPGEWPPVIARVADEFRRWVRQHRNGKAGL